MGAEPWLLSVYQNAACICSIQWQLMDIKRGKKNLVLFIKYVLCTQGHAGFLISNFIILQPQRWIVLSSFFIDAQRHSATYLGRQTLKGKRAGIQTGPIWC